jgi:nucleotide-binding universal stress UspA family protein
MKTIIVATDFSATAANAAAYAADMAVAVQADVLLLHTFQVPVSYNEFPVAVSLTDIQADAEKLLDQLKHQLHTKTGAKCKITTQARMGIFFEELKAVCEKNNPYAVVMGSQGTTAAERVLFGGHAVHTMKHLQWPVITVPAGIHFSGIKKIGLACDFEHVVETVPVQEVKKMISDFHAELHIINTGVQKTFDADIVFESGLLQEMLGTVKPNYHFITASDTDEGIIKFADENDIDLLIVLPKRHSLLDKLLWKSSTKQLVLHSHVPVMALHQ